MHGFHSYPGRMHPVTARRLIEQLCPEQGLVLDPFCGSGTVLIEAALSGRRAVGSDLNPLAVQLARIKSAGATQEQLQGWREAGEKIAQFAETRRLAKQTPLKSYSAAQRQLFSPHMLLELDSLASGVQAEAEPIRAALSLVLSAILTKVSRRPGDSTRDLRPKRLPGGFAIRAFAAKTNDLVARCQAFARALPRPARVKCFENDARQLTGLEARSVDLIVTSPPYPGVFDYLEHHRDRLRFLHLDARSLARREIGSRRQLAGLSPERALATWHSDLRRTLQRLQQLIKPSGHLALLMADSVIGSRAVLADQVIQHVAAQSGWGVEATAAQNRPYFHEPTRNAFKERPRQEFLIILSPTHDAAARATTNQRRTYRRAAPKVAAYTSND